MATDVLILGGLVFDDWSTPNKIPFGGKHSAAVHKLPGGSRVVDTLGPDEMDIAFTGMIWGDSAAATASGINSLRQSGQPVPLMFTGQFYQVILIDAVVHWERFPQYATYSISCLIVSAPGAGGLGAIVSTIGDTVGADMASVASISDDAIGISSSISSAVTTLSGSIGAAQPLVSAAASVMTGLTTSAIDLAGSIESAIPSVAGALDAGIAATTAPEIATALSGIVTSAGAQQALADMSGFAGRMASNLNAAQ